MKGQVHHARVENYKDMLLLYLGEFFGECHMALEVITSSIQGHFFLTPNRSWRDLHNRNIKFYSALPSDIRYD